MGLAPAVGRPGPGADGTLVVRATRLARLAALIAAAVAGTALAGWGLGGSDPSAAALGGAPMKPTTAAATLALCVAVAALGAGRAALARVLGAIALLVGLFALARPALGAGLGIEQLLLYDPDGGSPVGLMGPNTAVAIVLGATATVAHGTVIGDRRPSNALGLAMAVIGLLALVGYGAGIDSLATVGRHTTMGPATSTALTCLGMALLLIRPAGAVAMLVSPTLGGSLARRLLPVACLLPAALAYVSWKGQAAGIYGTNLGIVLLAVSTIAMIAMSIWRLARVLDARDSERRSLEAARAEAEALFHSAFDEAPIGMAIVDLDGTYATVNGAFAELVGYTPERLRGRGFASITHAEDVESDLRGLRAMLAGELSSYNAEKRYLHADGHSVWASLRVAVVRGADGRPERFLTQVEDVTDRHEYELELRHLADHDPLTGLLNRRGFERELESHVARTQRYGADGALLVVDVDRFKWVNDTFGHGAGDEAIRAVARLLSERVRDSDLVARLGGDEFAVLLPRGGAADAASVARKLCEAVRRHETAGGAGALSISVGVATLPDADAGAGVTAADLLIAADLAMYEAKQAGGDGWSLSVGAWPRRQGPPATLA